MNYAILIVDDDRAITDSVREYLSILSYEVRSAINAEEALETLKTFPAQVVLTDIMMEGMDGLELTRAIKKQYDIDVMVMTGYSADYSYEEAIHAGASDFIFKPFRFEELDLRVKRVLRESEFKKERDKLVQELEKLAMTDALTSLHNSRYFYQQIKAEIQRHKRYERALSLIILDIDFFKVYNDSWGHLEGDKVLMKIGEIITGCMRAMDSAYRYGGEEFAIILPETGIEKARVVGNRIRERIAAEVFHPQRGKSESVTVSMGAGQWDPEEDFTSFIRRTDEALYVSKENGRNRLSTP
ncbi:MAG: diguanylate cyclase [Desulfobacterales bacterium]|nr:diguanylate cyclase [Desulfobacterales bacterium]